MGSPSTEDIVEAAVGWLASSHTQTRGDLLCPVGIQAQIMRAGLRIAKRVLFIVPPLAVQAAATAFAPVGAERRTARIIGSGGRNGGQGHCSHAHFTGRML